MSQQIAVLTLCLQWPLSRSQQQCFASDLKLSLQLSLNWKLIPSHWLLEHQQCFAESFRTVVRTLSLQRTLPLH